MHESSGGFPAFEALERRTLLAAVALPVRLPVRLDVPTVQLVRTPVAVRRTTAILPRRGPLAPARKPTAVPVPLEAPFAGIDEAISPSGTSTKFNAGSGWNTTALTYSYSNLLDGGLPGGLAADQLRSLSQEALLTWASASPLTFTEQPDGGPLPTADDSNYNGTGLPKLRIGHHPFGGASGGLSVLAHGYFPSNSNSLGIAGDLHFNDSVKFVAGRSSSSGFAFLETAVHEIGHNLGLAHANGDVTNGVCPPAKPALMDACILNRYNGPGTAFLFADDVAGIQSLYGAGLGWLKDLQGNLYIDGTQAADTFTLSASGSTLTASSAGVGSFTRDLSDVSNVVVYGRGGSDRVNVLSLPAAVTLTVDGADGDDALTVATPALASRVTFLGGGGADSALIDGATAPAVAFYTVTPTQVRVAAGSASGSLDFSGIESLALTGGAAPAVYTVNGTFGGPVSITGGAGEDRIYVDDSTGPAVALDGGGGLDTVSVNGRATFATSQTLADLSLGASGKLALTGGGTIETKRLTVNASTGGAQLDLGDGALIVDYDGPSPLATVRSLLTSGYAGGAWNGPGVASSTAAAGSGRALGYGEASSILGAGGGSFAGRPVDGTAVLVRSTLYGDADLNRVVNGPDLQRLLGSFGRGAGVTWADGDFNFDGVAKPDDFDLLFARYGVRV